MIIKEIQHYDELISLYINSFHNSFTDSFMLFVSNKHVWIPMYLIFLLLLFKHLGYKKAVLVFLSVILSVAACDQFANLIKYSVGRLRPDLNYFMITNAVHIVEGKSNLFGFFSAHAANSFAVAVTISMGLLGSKKNTNNYLTHNKITDTRIKKAYAIADNIKFLCYFLMIWAAIVAISRVFLAKHFFGDIVVGSIVGLVFGYVIGLLTQKICNHLD